MRNRRAFTVSSFAVWVIVLFFLVAAGHLVFAMNDPRWRSSALIPFIMKFTVWPLVVVAVLTVGAWFICRRSDRVGNFVLCLLLLLLTGLRLAVMTGILTKGGRLPNTGPTLTPGPLVAPPPATAPSQPERSRPMPIPQGSVESPPPPLPPRSSAPPTTSAPTAVPTVVPGKSAEVQTVLDAIASEFAADVSAMWPEVEAAFAEWAKAPAHDMRVLDQRSAAAAELKAAAERLSTRFRDASNEVQNRLVDAGVNATNARTESGRFRVSYNATWRATACDSIGRAADRVIEESAFLKQNFSKWSLDSKGELSSTDAIVKGHARGLRSRVEFGVRDQQKLRTRLDEGR